MSPRLNVRRVATTCLTTRWNVVGDHAARMSQLRKSSLTPSQFPFSFPSSLEVRAVPIAAITVLNPRSRNKKIFQELVTSIAHLGLKKPITVRSTSGWIRLRPRVRSGPPRGVSGAWGKATFPLSHNPATEKTIEPSTAGVRRGSSRPTSEAPGHPRAIVWLRLAAWDS
jgi:hypothetical protein